MLVAAALLVWSHRDGGAAAQFRTRADVVVVYATVTDDKGRFALIGLSSGEWKFVAEAPGYELRQGTTRIRATVTDNPPLTFTLPPADTRIPGTLDKDILEEIAAADAHRAAGRFEQAISAYERIAQENPRLTLVSLMSPSKYHRSKITPCRRRSVSRLSTLAACTAIVCATSWSTSTVCCTRRGR